MARLSKRKRIKRLGREAYRKGVPLMDCPFFGRFQKTSTWLSGWFDEHHFQLKKTEKSIPYRSK